MDGAATEMAMPESRTLDKGLIFVKDTNILPSGDKWTVVVNNALDDYNALAHTMKITLNQLRPRIRAQKNPKSYGFDVYWDELNRLDTMVQGFNSDLQSFRKLIFEETLSRNAGIGSTRTKRGLISFLGYGLKYLFGTADAHDVKRLYDVCDELHGFKLKMAHAIDHQLTYILTLDKDIKQNILDIASLKYYVILFITFRYS